MAARNRMQSAPLSLKAPRGRAVVAGEGPRIPAVQPDRDDRPGRVARAHVWDPVAYDGDEGGLRRFSEDLSTTDGRYGDIPAVRPASPPRHAFSESDYFSGLGANEDGVIPAVGHSGND